MPKNIREIKQLLAEMVGKKVTLTAYEARNVVIEHKGTLSSTYPSVFVIDLDSYPKSVDRVSYNYSDILTGYVELKVN
jgi:uncharacterized protein Veg